MLDIGQLGHYCIIFFQWKYTKYLWRPVEKSHITVIKLYCSYVNLISRSSYLMMVCLHLINYSELFMVVFLGNIYIYSWQKLLWRSLIVFTIRTLPWFMSHSQWVYDVIRILFVLIYKLISKFSMNNVLKVFISYG